jgi:hypothetical protein
MKRVFISIYLGVFSVFSFFGATTLSVDIIELDSQIIMGATHERVQRELSEFGTTVKQTYHYLSADFQESTFAMITGDDYSATGYRPATTLKHAQNSQTLYDDYVIIGGVNADFFESYGVPQEAYIEDGQIISSGIGYANREVIGFKEDGSIVFGKPVFEGYEVILRDENGRERIRLPLTNINTPYSTSAIDIYAYFDTYNTALPQGVYKYVANIIESKGAIPKIFGSGIVSSLKSLESIVVPDQTIVLASNNTYLQNLVQLGDTMIVQRKMIGDFSGVKWAVGAYGKLVSSGEKVENIIGIDPNSRHPRTAIGVKQNGSVFLVAMDGRQTGYSQGATLHEMADLMLSYGAVTAYNFDGGGSTTMVLRNEDSGFDVVNQPSDGTPRQVTNSIFLALRINNENSTPYPIPDYSIRLNRPSNITVNQGVLTFDAVEGRTNYQIIVGENELVTTSTRVELNSLISQPGTYSITVKATGDGILYKDSLISEIYNYQYDGPIKLNQPSLFSLSEAGILSWSDDIQRESYLFEISDKSYTIYLNRFNLTTLNLEPGIYTITVTTFGDGFNTINSSESTYVYRVYSRTEKSISESLKLILELLYLKNRG